MTLSTEIMRRFNVVLAIVLLIGAWPWSMGAAPSSSSVTVGTGEDMQALSQPSDTGARALPTFTNVSDSVGLAGVGGTFFDWVDYNNDGFMDFMVDGHSLYQNSGPPGYTFTEVSAQKGLGTAWGRAVWGDYDNDGYKDLYDADWSDHLFHNNGPPNYTFTDVTDAAGKVRDSFPGTAASWGDYNNDGYLDLYVVNGEVWHADNTATWYPDTFWKNNGNGTFTNVTIAAHVDESASPYYGRGATWADYDNDGRQDIYISNYRIDPNYLYYNNGDGTFTERGKELGAAGHGRNGQGQPADLYYGHTIGSSWADLNNDGRLDIFVANLAHKDPDRGRYCDNSNIFINNGYPYWNFTDIRSTSGIPIKPTGGVIDIYYNDENWANAAIADFDNDGYLDIYIPQVYNQYWMYSYLYQNMGDLTFKNVSHQLNLDNIIDSYAGAWADYNNDGTMDLLAAGRLNEWGNNDVKTPALVRLYKNNGNGNHWLEVNLTGVQSNKNGIGAQVTAHVGQKGIVRQVETGMGSHGQQNDMRLNFGLGSATKVDSLEIRWPSGIVQVLKDIQADQWINVTEDVSGPTITSLTANPPTAFPDTQITIQATVTGNPATLYWDYEGDQGYDVTANANAPQSFIAMGKWDYHPTLKVMNAAGTLGAYRTTKVHIKDMQPVAALTYDKVVLEEQNATFNASGSTDTTWDKINLTYQFFFGDGTNTSQSREKMVQHNYTEMGNYSINLTVMDPYGASSSVLGKVWVKDVAPMVNITANASIPEDSVLKLDAKGNDTPTDLAKGLSYKWDFGDGSFKTGWLLKPATTHLYTKPGLYNITVYVKDHNAASGSNKKALVVYDLPPSVQVSTRTIVTREDDLVFLSGTGTDTPTDVSAGLNYMWDFGDGNASNFSLDPTASHAYPNNGTYIARLIVKDPEGLEGNDTVKVFVTNQVPITEIVDVPTDIPEDQLVDFVGKGTDTLTDQLSLHFKWDFGDGSSSPWSLEPTVRHSYTRAGEKSVVFYVRDNDNASSFAEATARVTNQPPIVNILKPDKTTFDEDTTVTFEGNATDNPSDIHTLNFTWSIDGKDYQGMKVDHVFTGQGSYDITLTVTDDEGAQDKEVVTIKINNVPPKVTLKASRTTVNMSESVVISAKATDTTSDMPTLKYAWGCGVGNTLMGGTTPNATCTFNFRGVNTVKVIVTDDEGATATAQVDVTVLAKGGGGGGGGGVSTAAIAGAGVAVVAVVLVLALLLMRKKGDVMAERVPKVDEEQEVTPKATRTKKVKVQKVKEGPEAKTSDGKDDGKSSERTVDDDKDGQKKK